MIRIFIEIRDLIYITNFSLMSVNEIVASHKSYYSLRITLDILL